MSLQVRLANLVTAVGTDIKSLTGKIGTLSSLTTTAKTDLVSAVNEVKASVGSAGAQINDTTASGTTVYSSNKTNSVVSSAVAALVNGAPAAFDTLKEISDQLAADEAGTATMFANRLRVDASQGLTSQQQQFGRDNLSVYSQAQLGDPETDLVALYTTAKS